MKPDSTDTAANAPATDEFAGAPGYAERSLNEFPEGAGELDEPSRRRFLTYMGASIALATGAGCNLRPAQQRKIVPYTTQPDELTPGVPLFFASAHPFGGFGSGVLVRSNEGRPTKVEGNPDHPGSLGGTALHAQASVLDLYDPNRSTSSTHRGQPISYDQVVSALRGKLFTGNNTPNAGLRIRILTESVTSPTLVGQLTTLLNTFPSARWVQFDAVSSENARNGNKKAFGKDVNVSYDFLKADVVLSFEADVLCSGPGSARYARDFADRRKIRENGKDRAELDAGRQAGRTFKEGVKHDPKTDPKDSLINRLYAVECMPTNTGAVADHRIALTTAQIGSFVSTLAAALKVPGVSAAGSWSEGQAKWLGALAEDLQAKKGKSIVVAGDHLPAWVHTLVAAINVTLGNVGSTVKVSPPVAAQVAGKMSDIKALTDELRAKAIDVLVILGGANPAYSAPAELDFAGALKAFGEDTSKFSLHLGMHQDETGVLCDWHTPEAHYLETWGDIRAYDGTVTIQQPLIAPLHGGHSAIELLGTLIRPAEATSPGSPRDPLDIVTATWTNADEVKKTFPNYQKPAIFAPFWQECVRSGVVPGTAAVEEKAGLAGNWAADLGAGTGPAVGADELELNFRACPSLHDGRFATNGWLQELPKPLTKISWDNAVFVSPKTVSEKKLGDLSPNFRWTGGEHGRAEVGLVEIKVKVKLPDGKEEERKVTAPVWVLPGHADNAVTIHLGHGRERAGRPAMLTDYRVVKPTEAGPDEKNAEGKPVHGFNAYPLRAGSTWAVGAKVARVGGKYFLAQTQGHWSMEERDPISGKMLDRKPVRRGTLDSFKANPLFAKIPPMAAGETTLINENIPLPKKKEGEKKDEHGHGDGHNSHARITPLNMYNPAEGLVPDLRDSQRRRWAMAIDLSSCTGCSACVVACVSENNTAVVGKEQVTKGREMYWISIDRYYEGLDAKDNDPSAVKAYFQPRMCVQCENAPCEIVCPVGATVHSADGLNDMTYNRCVGTRYCSNNCPYKVRRFNFLTLQNWDNEVIKLGRNPEVSVRSRGVMEKCTFCVQRLRGAEIVAEREQRPIRDGEILTACQSACPSGAIVFGDINDPDAAVSRWKNEPTNYGLLAEINTRPRLTHMAVVRNPNPALK